MSNRIKQLRAEQLERKSRSPMYVDRELAEAALTEALDGWEDEKSQHENAWATVHALEAKLAEQERLLERAKEIVIRLYDGMEDMVAMPTGDYMKKEKEQFLADLDARTRT